jgi:carbamate kinase
MRQVIALGGNALLKRGELLSAENQRRNMKNAAAALANICAEHENVIVHGNGPQIGLLALEAAAYTAVPPYPFDILGAESQGMVGYIIAQELRNALPHCDIAALLTQTCVDPNDPAFNNPTKPIGPVYDAIMIAELRQKNGWNFTQDGNGMRRIVASPLPKSIIEFSVIEKLMTSGIIVVCAGGGGIPICIDPDGKLRGVEAVIDKDHTAALLAIQLHANRLIILTDVDAVYLNWNTPQQKVIRQVKASELIGVEFAAGSMGPKIAAACRFVSETANSAFIGSLADVHNLMAGKSGTQIDP